MIINDSNIEEVMAQGKPVVLDFWATWCGPCKKIAPYIQELADKYEGQAIVGKVNVEDDAEDLVLQYQIGGIPTVVFINKDGEEVDRLTSAASKNVYEQKLQALLG